MLKRLNEFILKFPKSVVMATLLSIIIFANGIRFLHADTDVTRDLPQSIPAKQLYDRIDKIFPSKEMLVVGLEDPKILTIDGLRRLDQLTQNIEKTEGVQSVMSPSNARVISSNDGMMQVKAAADPLPTDAASLAAFKKKIADQPMIQGNLINARGDAAIIMVFIKAGVREADVAERVIKLSQNKEKSQGYTLYITGRPAATYWSKVIMGRDMGMLTSAALLIVLLILALSFRSLRGVLLPIGVVVTAVIWTLGLMGYASLPITHATEILPILLVAIGVADGIHILKTFYSHARSSADASEAVRTTMNELSLPVVFTSVTTMAGFLALGSSGVSSIMSLGALTAFGVFAAMVFSLTFIPASLALMKLPGAKKQGSQGQRLVWAEQQAGRYAQLLIQHRRIMAALVLTVIALAIWGGTRVESEFSNLSNYREDHPFLKASLVVNKNFASISNVIIVVEGEKPDAMKDPVVLHKMDQMEQWLKKQDHIGSVQSLLPFIKQMNRVMHDDKPSEYRLPNVEESETGVDYVEENGEEVEKQVQFKVPGKELIAQYLTLYEMSGKPDDFANLVTYDYSTARMTVMIDSDKASVLTDLHNKVQNYLDKNFAGHFVGVKAELTGMAELMRAVNQMVVKAQAWSIATSLLLVFILTALMFRSVVLGLFATLPLFFSLFLNFGFMGLAGIPLNIMTMTTSSIAVGVGVDYAIHFVHRYRHELKTLGDDQQAVIACMRSSGLAIFLNAATVALGFFALFFSEFRGVAQMGLLISLTMITSAFAALTILPVMFSILKPRALRK